MHLLSALHPDLPAVGPRRAAAAAAGRGRHGEKILHRAQGAEILPVTENTAPEAIASGAALQLGAQLLLREAAGVAQAAQIVAKIAIPP